MVQVRGKLLGDLGYTHVHVHLKSCFTKSFKTRASNTGVGVLHTHHHTRHPGSNDRLGTWRRTTDVVARLERDVQRCTASRISGGA